MKFTSATVLALAGSAAAWPGMSALIQELAKRQGPTPGGLDAPMIGDLATIGAITPVGKQVKSCLQGTISCESPGAKVSLTRLSRATGY